MDNELIRAGGEGGEQGADLVSHGDCREPFGSVGPLDCDDVAQWDVEDRVVQEREGVERLVLRDSGDVAVRGEMVQEVTYVGGVEGVGMGGVSDDPPGGGALGVETVLSAPTRAPDSVKAVERFDQSGTT